MKRLALSLLLLTGTSLAVNLGDALSPILESTIATNTGNVLDPNPTDGFLDGKYDYPNIHSHNPDDPVIFTGSPKYLNTADELVKVSDYVGEDQVMSGINWAVDYQSVVDATIFAGVILYDASSNLLDSEVGSYDVSGTSGNYVSISGTYSNPLILPDVEFISFTIGGISDRGGTDDIRLTNPTLSIDYHDKVADAILEEIINDIIDNAGEVIKVEEIQLEPLVEAIEAMVEDVAEEEEAEEVAEVVQEIEVVEEVAEVAEVVVEVASEAMAEVKAEVKVEAKKSPKKQVKKATKKTSKKTVKKGKVAAPNGAPTPQDIQTTDAVEVQMIQTMQLIKSINVMNQVTLVDTVDISSYTGITLSDSVELEDNEDWYQNQAFYEEIGMSDSGILNGYNNVKMNDGEWYGSDNQFY